jgi:AraC-like DNA-binding protein
MPAIEHDAASHQVRIAHFLLRLREVTRQRITQAQQLIRETSRSLIDVGLEVGYSSPSHFAQVVRRETGPTPSDSHGSIEKGVL